MRQLHAVRVGFEGHDVWALSATGVAPFAGGAYMPFCGMCADHFDSDARRVRAVYSPDNSRWGFTLTPALPYTTTRRVMQELVATVGVFPDRGLFPHNRPTVNHSR